MEVRHQRSPYIIFEGVSSYNDHNLFELLTSGLDLIDISINSPGTEIFPFSYFAFTAMFRQFDMKDFYKRFGGSRLFRGFG